jgi:hypothetical protein
MEQLPLREPRFLSNRPNSCPSTNAGERVRTPIHAVSRSLTPFNTVKKSPAPFRGQTPVPPNSALRTPHSELLLTPYPTQSDRIRPTNTHFSRPRASASNSPVTVPNTLGRVRSPTDAFHGRLSMPIAGHASRITPVQLRPPKSNPVQSSPRQSKAVQPCPTCIFYLFCAGVISPQNGPRFSLSPRERDGVRGKEAYSRRTAWLYTELSNAPRIPAIHTS